MVRLTRDPIDGATLTASVGGEDVGGVVTFLGCVRRHTGDVVTEAIEYEAYDDMAVKEMRAIELEVRERWPVLAFTMIHRLGKLNVGEASVAVAVGCPHRAPAFEACRYAIDRLKERVPIWKREFGPDGRTEWVSP